MKQKLVSFAVAIICGHSIANAWPWMSPYAYCFGNPINCVDPDGRDVLIWYQDRKGNDQSFLYNGTQKKVPNNSFVLDFVRTYNY